MALIVRHVDDLEWLEARRVEVDGRPASVWNRMVDMTEDRTVAYTRYDAGVMLARHSHYTDEVIFIIEGDVTVGDQNWPAGTVAILEQGTLFGPLVAGPNGALLFEMFTGRADRSGQDRTGYDELLHASNTIELPNPAFTLPPLRPRGEQPL
jgi:hypothetical protein